jgi:hypothetical protein
MTARRQTAGRAIQWPRLHQRHRCPNQLALARECGIDKVWAHVIEGLAGGWVFYRRLDAHTRTPLGDARLRIDGLDRRASRCRPRG